MGQRLNAIDQSRSVMLASLFRKIFTLVEGLTAVGGVMGSLTLIAGTGTPPVSVLRSVGLTSWVLPGLWLFPTPAAPSAAAAVLAWRKSKWAPPVVLLASATLAIELLVQIPFLGPSWHMQAVWVRWRSA